MQPDQPLVLPPLIFDSRLREWEWEPWLVPSSLHLNLHGEEWEAWVYGYQRQGKKLAAIVGKNGPYVLPVSEGRGLLFQRYVDFSLLSRFLFYLLEKLGAVDYLLLERENEWRLYNAREEYTYGTDGAKWLGALAVEEMYPLWDVPPDIPSRPKLESLQEENQKGLNLMAARFGPFLQWSRSETENLMHHLLLGLETLRVRSEEGWSPLGWEWSIQDGTIQGNWQPPPESQWLEPLLNASEWLLAGNGKSLDSLNRKALTRQWDAMEPKLSSFLQDILRIGRCRLNSASLSALFFPAEEEHKSWKLALMEPLDLNVHIQEKDFYIFQPLELDLLQSGVGRALDAFDKLLLHGIQLKEKMHKAGGRQLDILEEMSHPLEDRVVQDPLSWVLRRALRIALPPSHQPHFSKLLAFHLLHIKRKPHFPDFPLNPLRHLSNLFH